MYNQEDKRYHKSVDRQKQMKKTINEIRRSRIDKFSRSYDINWRQINNRNENCATAEYPSDGSLPVTSSPSPPLALALFPAI